MSVARDFTIPSLIQGISQQSPQGRALAAADDEANVLNSVLDDCVSRVGFTHQASFGGTYSEPYTVFSRRSKDEKYKFVIESGELRVFNVAEGTECTVTGAVQPYFQHTGPARKSFATVQAEDTMFIANKEVVLQMDAELSPAAPNWALFHLKAGAYKTRYRIAVFANGNSVVAEHVTDDSSSSANEGSIKTDSIAFHLAAGIENGFNSDPVWDGFSVEQSAGTVKIEAPVGVTMEIDTYDGQAGTHLIPVTDSVSKFSDLPERAFDGHVTRVESEGSDPSKEDYYVRFSTRNGRDSGDGTWKEVIKPETPVRLDAATLPLTLKRVEKNQFEVAEGLWGARLSGDGVETSKDPEFIGSTIESLQFLSSRLSIITEGSVTLSKTKNGFVFFPDTAQTQLDDAPISYQITNGQSTLARQSTIVAGRLQVWADGIQVVMDSGQEAIKEDSVELVPITAYEFDGNYMPLPIGRSGVLFGSEEGQSVKVMEVYYRGKDPSGEISINAQCPRLIDGPLRSVSHSSSSNIAAFLSEGAPSSAYVYQWFNNGDERVLSAWNPWTFNACSKVLSCVVSGNTMHTILQWPDDTISLETMPMDWRQQDATFTFPIRLDHRTHHLTEDSTYTLPSPIDDPEKWFAIETGEGGGYRGREVPWEAIDDNTISLTGDDPFRPFYFGRRIYSFRKQSEFVLQVNDQPVLPDSITLIDVKVSHTDAARYRSEVRYKDGTKSVEEFVSRTIGGAGQTNDTVPIESGSHTFSVGAEASDAEITLINDTWFPCAWSSKVVSYTPITRRNDR